ncbi:MAG TPA: excinuclease ABC subunit UvrC [Thermosynergistes sp.]|nr:excinuclease ABC subunit UvrC [Thermosynergistes sp.]
METKLPVPEALKDKVRRFPDRPGVYIMHDESGRVIYVGKARSLKKRVLSYFRHAQIASPRLRKLIHSISDISFIRTETEAEALVVEAKLIKQYQPFFNVELKMGERYPYVRITNERFPRLIITRHREDDGSIYIGPYTRVSELRQVLRLVERYFPLRSCSATLESIPARERPCLRHFLGKCLAPCTGVCSESEYRDRVDEIIMLLRGQALPLVERLRAKMEKAVEVLAFEEAARMRDAIRAVWRLSRQKVSYSLSEDLDKDTWCAMTVLQSHLQLAALPWRIDGCDISHLSGRESYGVFVVFEQGVANPSLYRKFRIRTVEGVDDFRCIEEVVYRRYRRLLDEEEALPQLLLVDGGAVQLQFALQALHKLGLDDLPVVAIAKEEETLYLPGEKAPLRLSREDPGLKLLQRVRDEAHRFAVSSHRHGRDQRYRRSALEEIPGVGKRRAAALLAMFGSVARISDLEPEQLTAVPGVGPSLAKRIIDTLREGKDVELSKAP